MSEELLPERVLSKLALPLATSKIPKIEPYQVYNRIKKMNLPASTVPGDFPPRIWKLFSVELSTPIAIMINKILESGEWPNIFKTEWVTVIGKTNNPEDKGDLQNLSLTMFISKLIENMVYDLLLEQWGHKIDSAQFGGRKGYSVTLYLIKLVDFILLNLDKSMAVLIGLIDFSKAYNRQCHNRLLTCYSDLGTPTYLLKILKSYLTKRKMIVRHGGKFSSVYDLPAGGAQGTNLGVLSFLVYINSCGVSFDKMADCLNHEHKEKYIGLPVEENQDTPIATLGWTKICHPVLPQPGPHITESQARFRYIDDKVTAEAIKTSNLKPITTPMERPLNFRDRTLHQLPTDMGSLQTNLLEIDKYCHIQKMKINSKKSKTAVFNAAKTRDFYPRLVNNDGDLYENVEDFTLLGVDFVSDQKLGVKWEKYILKCIKKAYCNMWILKRLAEMGVRKEDLVMTFQSRIRTHVEQNTPLYNFAISQKLSLLIEKVQKSCVYIMLGKHATSNYAQNLSMLNLEPLDERRMKLCNNFAKKTIKHTVHSKMFTLSKRTETRSKPKVIIPSAKTRRYDSSSIPSLARIINKL